MENETCVKWLLEHGADPNVRGKRGITPLATAALYPSTAILELLLSHGAELDPQALYKAICPRGRGGMPIMRFLIDRGIDVNSPSKPWPSPLHYAVYVGDKERVQLLLDKGADRTCKGALGQTAAERAKSKGRLDIYEIISSES